MSDIIIANTLNRKKDKFIPLKKGFVSIYTCGPTVYFYPHIGNMRSYIMNDLIKRVFIYNGYKIKHIMNITDVGHLTSDADDGEDKMEKAKQRENKSAWDIAKFYTNIFKEYSKQLNIIAPKKYINATDCIDEQIKFVELLEAKGFLYKISDGLYFDTSKLSDYGKLANVDIKQLQAGARIEFNKAKKNPTDFAVWKFSPANKKRDMEWDSPWGKGFPGWHLECSVISSKYLGQPFDIHTGGVDHINVHHTNEMAQSEAAYDKPLATYWIHFEHLNLKEGKMAKSTGNIITVDTLLEKNIDPLALRFFVLQTHYAKTISFTWEALEAAQAGFKKLQYILADIKDRGKINNKYKTRFIELINNDFSSPEALALVWLLLKDKSIPDGDKKETILDFDNVLGLNLAKFKLPKIPTSIKKLAAQRWQAKTDKDYKLADKIRNELLDKGYIIDDAPNNYIIQKK